MFIAEQQAIETQIQAYCLEAGLPIPEDLQWNPIPFSGEWGISTSFFKLAALEARLLKKHGEIATPVPQRAQEIASLIAEGLGNHPSFSRIDVFIPLKFFSSTTNAERPLDPLERSV